MSRYRYSIARKDGHSLVDATQQILDSLCEDEILAPHFNCKGSVFVSETMARRALALYLAHAEYCTAKERKAERARVVYGEVVRGVRYGIVGDELYCVRPILEDDLLSQWHDPIPATDESRVPDIEAYVKIINAKQHNT